MQTVKTFTINEYDVLDYYSLQKIRGGEDPPPPPPPPVTPGNPNDDNDP